MKKLPKPNPFLKMPKKKLEKALKTILGPELRELQSPEYELVLEQLKKKKPIETSMGTHIDCETYKLDGKTYRILYFMDGSGQIMIEEVLS